MIITFVELERSDEAYFRQALPGQEVRFVETLEDVSEETEILVPFITYRIEDAFLEQHPRLRFIATRSGATDFIDLAACRRQGVPVSFVPDFGDTTVAEHTFALLLALSRRLREVMASTQKLSAHPARFSYEDARGFDLMGKTIGIIGMGRIGRRVRDLALAFQMHPVAYDPFAMPPEQAAAGRFRWLPLEELLRQSHIVTLHARISPETRHMLNRETLALCLPGALIINTARGALIDTEALGEALASGQIGGAGLDVLEDEQVLRKPASQIISAQIIEQLHREAEPGSLPADDRLRHLQHIVRSDALLARHNVVFTPHVAFNSVEAVERLYAGLVKNLQACLAGKPINLAERD